MSANGILETIGTIPPRDMILCGVVFVITFFIGMRLLGAALRSEGRQAAYYAVILAGGAAVLFFFTVGAIHDPNASVSAGLAFIMACIGIVLGALASAFLWSLRRYRGH